MGPHTQDEQNKSRGDFKAIKMQTVDPKSHIPSVQEHSSSS